LLGAEGSSGGANPLFSKFIGISLSFNKKYIFSIKWSVYLTCMIVSFVVLCLPFMFC
jgi:hypothetical protein